jgi:hypothetical protein
MWQSLELNILDSKFKKWHYYYGTKQNILIFLGKAPTLEELDPNTKEYWRKVRIMGIRRKNQLSKLKKF